MHAGLKKSGGVPLVIATDQGIFLTTVSRMNAKPGNDTDGSLRSTAISLGKF